MGQIKGLSQIKFGWTLFIIDFILPLPLTIVMAWLWYQRSDNLFFTTYVILLPLLFGYLIPGIGTNLLNLWAFKWNYLRAGNYFLHHGFMYAPYFALAVYLTLGDFASMTMTHAVTFVISNTFLQCFLTTFHDYMGVKSGMIEIYNKPYREGKTAAEIIMDYGPIGYALFGFTYAVSCLGAYYYFVIHSETSLGRMFILLLAGLLLMGAAGLHYVYREYRIKKASQSDS